MCGIAVKIFPNALKTAQLFGMRSPSAKRKSSALCSVGLARLRMAGREALAAARARALTKKEGRGLEGGAGENSPVIRFHRDAC